MSFLWGLGGERREWVGDDASRSLELILLHSFPRLFCCSEIRERPFAHPIEGLQYVRVPFLFLAPFPFDAT